ncbi:CRE-KAL-1 protein [Aphelenchoides avenae]|nr:CRE-KAL-1 protein [Aphelenchus avenae]
MYWLQLVAYSSADDLLSARCQSKCLYDLERRHKENPELKRQLKHHITNVCKDDAKCSSCALPCRESFFDNQTCTRNLCQECSATCNVDGDCAEAEKCCTEGCSRKCVAPVDQDIRLLPTPEGITIQERKRKRSAVVRWIMKRMLPQHMATNSNLYVLQWRWSVQKDEATMTPWQTIMVKNKMYAILKHLLAPGRYYTFRVGAVNVYGSLGFSKSSMPFKLTKEVKAPSSPVNLTTQEVNYDDAAQTWRAEVTWAPPSSDLPLKDYQLSWWKVPAEFANAYEERQLRRTVVTQPGKRSTIVDADEEADETYGYEAERRSTIVPSHSTSVELDNLEPNQLFATVESADGELRGEPAICFIRTNLTVSSTLATTPTPSQSARTAPTTPENPLIPLSYELRNVDVLTSSHNDNSVEVEIRRINQHNDDFSMDRSAAEAMKDEKPVFRAEVKAPYFEDGKLRTDVSWLDHPMCSPTRRIFLVKIQTTTCAEEMLPTEVSVQQCVASFDQLSFDCEYSVEITAAVSNEVISKAAFKTLPCDKTPSAAPLICSSTATFNASVAQVQDLQCETTSNATVTCKWPVFGEDNVIGYRTVLSSTGGVSAISIVPASSQFVELTELKSELDYRLRVQAVTATGLGPEKEVEFNTRPSGDLADPSFDRFPLYTYMRKHWWSKLRSEA